MDLLIFLAGIALLILLGMVLAWPPDEDPPAGKHHRDSVPKAVPRSGKAPGVPAEVESGRRAWVASIRESGWHAVDTSIRGRSIVAACGHRVSGRMHRRLGNTPPTDELRSICGACVHTVGYLEPRLFRPPGLIAYADADPDWPTTDPDEATDEPVETAFTPRPATPAVLAPVA